MRENFLQVLRIKDGSSAPKLDHLNQHFSDWVDEYNNREHSSTKQSPIKRFQDGISHVRPAPNGLLDYFRQIEYRRVKKDRTVRVMGGIFEVPVGLIDKKVELRFHPEDLSQIEVYFDGKSYGLATVVNAHVNAEIGRNWDPKKNVKEKSVEVLNDVQPAKSGELFQKSSELTISDKGDL